MRSVFCTSVTANFTSLAELAGVTLPGSGAGGFPVPPGRG